jgi:inorganic triphosphatase YgiF
MAKRETELKLWASPRTLARLAADPLLGAPRGPARRLTAVYFDSPRFGFWRRGLTLRLRRERGRWIQALKGGGSLEAGLHRRIELERRASGPAPDLSLVRGEPLGKLAARVAGSAALVPVFRVEVSRATRVVSPAPGEAIEVSLDQGAIVAGTSRAPVREIELELKRGPAWRVFDLAREIASRYPVRVETRTKAERGYALAGGARPAPVRARLAVIGPEMSANEAFAAACALCLNHLQANAQGVIRGADPEYLHQARVALRRLRAVLGAFAPLGPEKEFERRIAAVRALARSLGPARDWDVFAGETLAPVVRQFPGHRGLAALERAAARLREQANRAARRVLVSRRYQRFVLEMGGWLARQPWLAAGTAKQGRAWRAPVREHAREVLERCHRRMLKRGRGIGHLSMPRLHRLRIAAKRLRYAVAFFAALFERRHVKPMLAALNELQDVLGAINDRATAPALIDSAYAAARGPLRREARTIVGHWNSAMREERRRALKRAWKAFQGCGRFWR